MAEDIGLGELDNQTAFLAWVALHNTVRGVMKLWHLYVTPRAEQAQLSQALARLGSVQPVRPAAPIGF